MNQRKNVFYFSRPAPFPQLLYVGYIGMIISIVQVFMRNYSQAGFIMLISLVILIMRSWSRLNLKTKTLIDVFSIIPYRKVSINPVLGISFTNEKVSRILNSRGNTSNIHYLQYKIVLHRENESIVLQEGRKKKRLCSKAMVIAAALNVPFKDSTNGQKDSS